VDDSSARRDLLAAVQSLISRTYGVEDTPDAAPFIIGDRGLDELYEVGPDARRPMVLVRSHEGRHHLRVYYPDALIANLEAHDPRCGLSEANLRDFATFTEELDHFVLLASRIAQGQEVPALELELHANVTKVLIAALFLARTLGIPRLTAEQRALLRHELLLRGDYASEPPDLRERYLEARRHALRFLDRIERTLPSGRPDLLREFSRSPLQKKLALCA